MKFVPNLNFRLSNVVVASEVRYKGDCDWILNALERLNKNVSKSLSSEL